MAQKFREKGATGPDRAMTVQDLGLGPRFEEAMKRRVGQTGIFVDVGGKYYFNEDRLREFEQRRQGMGAARAGGQGFRRNMATLRIVQMSLMVFIVALILISWVYGRSYDLWILVAVLLVAWIAISVYGIFAMSRARSRMGTGGPGPF